MKRKLLFFASDFQIGLSALLTDQLISISNAGIPVYAVAGEKEQEKGLEKIILDKGIDIQRIKGLDEHSKFLKLVKQIKNIVIQENIGYIHVQNNWQLALAYTVKNILRFRRSIKIAYTIHGFRNNHPLKSKFAQIIIGSALFIAADRILCMTKYLKRHFKILSYKIKLVPLGIKDDFFSNVFIPPKDDSLQLIFPAQFREGKNQDLIIHAFNDYLKRTNDCKSTLILPGGGTLLGQMKKLTSDLGITNQVIFPGLLPKDKVRELYLASNAAIVASISETFGQSIVEPFVLGRCIISTAVGIAPEIIKQGDNGFIFNSKKELTDIFISIASNKNLLNVIGEKNFSERDDFRWDNITKRYIQALGLDQIISYESSTRS